VICGIIATHGKLGEELIRTAERIAGPQERLHFVSNEGLSVDALAGVISDHVSGCDLPDGIIIMTDIPGGSPTLACRSLRLGGRRAWVVSGANLPMVLAFILCRDSMGPEEVAKVIAARASKAIEVVD
jgi:mannose/fructose-specific phosphotransferase system component IIA